MCVIGRSVCERGEKSGGELILPPTQFGMPLHPDPPAVSPRLLQSLCQAVRTPCSRAQIPTQLFDRLMMVTINQSAFATRKPRERACGLDLDSVRMPFAWRALLVLECVRHGRDDVLYERAAARDVPNLHPVTDRKKRQTPLL